MKRKQQILYGLLALVIIFIIYKYMFKKTDNFSIGSPWCSSRPCNYNKVRCGRHSECFWAPKYNVSGSIITIERNAAGQPTGGRCEVKDW